MQLQGLGSNPCPLTSQGTLNSRNSGHSETGVAPSAQRYIRLPMTFPAAVATFHRPTQAKEMTVVCHADVTWREVLTIYHLSINSTHRGSHNLFGWVPEAARKFHRIYTQTMWSNTNTTPADGPPLFLRWQEEGTCYASTAANCVPRSLWDRLAPSLPSVWKFDWTK
jgi:hypothetical protein